MKKKIWKKILYFWYKIISLNINNIINKSELFLLNIKWLT